MKTVSLDDGVELVIIRRRGVKNLKLSINPNGDIRLSMPKWTPYSAGIAFARSNMSWINSHRPDQKILEEGQLIGRQHSLHYVSTPGTKPFAKLKDQQIIIGLPSNLNVTDPQTQALAHKTSLKALRQQANIFLPKRTQQLAQMYDYEYQSVKIRLLTRRWGSCDQNRNITYNLYLMLLNDTQIDYVILHELVHTKIPNHGSEFWEEMSKNLPNAKQIKKTLNNQQPSLYSRDNALMS